MRLNWRYEEESWIEWRTGAKRLKRTLRKDSRDEVKTEDGDNEAENRVWEWKGKIKNSRGSSNKTT